jgi:hypothetical protein
MTRATLLLTALFAAAAVSGCGPGQARPPADPLPPLQGKAAPPVATAGDSGPMKAPLPPRP